jgi:hypothetical protein
VQSDFIISGPQLLISEKPVPGNIQNNRLEDRYKLAETNLAWLPSALKPTETWSAALKWLHHDRLKPGRSNSASQLVCTSVEKLIFARALSLRDDPPKIETIPEIQAMHSVVDEYRLHVRKSQQTAARMEVSILSRELLVVWSAFCLAHQTAEHEHPMLQKYGVALEASDLKHLVLSDKEAVDAARVVATYLRVSSKRGRPIFSFRADDQTFHFARRFARESSEIMGVWELDVKASEQRKMDRWQEVLLKQDRIRTLREELTRYENDLCQTKRRLDLLYPRWISYGRSNNHEYREAQSRIEELTGKISDHKREIEQEEEPPEPLLQPLPVTEHNAMPILFFLQMPTIFRNLSRLSFLAQEMLLPNAEEIVPPTPSFNDDTVASIKIMVEIDPPKTSWKDYYQIQRGTCSPVASEVTLGSLDELPERDQIGPKNVMNYKSSNDGVWYPDPLAPRMWWKQYLGRYWHYIDPFKEIDSRATVLSFTERLPASAKMLQWSMPIYSNNMEMSRGNAAMACQDVKPKWLKKQEFLRFTALRAYPNQQDRKICTVLHERSLPFDNVRLYSIHADALCFSISMFVYGL